MIAKVLIVFCLLSACQSRPETEVLDLVPEKPSSEVKISSSSLTPTVKTNEKCTTDGKQGKCIPYYMCDKPKENAEKEGLIDIHFNIEEPSCESYIDVCCLEDNIMEKPIAKTVR